MPGIDTGADLRGVKLKPVESDVPDRERVPGGFVYAASAIPLKEIGGIDLRQLARLHRDPSHPLAVEVSAPCAQGCGTMIRAARMFAGVTSCESCREKADKAEKMNRARIYWEAICPADYRDTDREHPAFPRGQYEATKDFNGGESLFFIGPSRAGKTRLAVLLLKRCLVKFNQHVGILWPEQLKQVKANNVNRLEWVEKWGRYDLLLWDDSLLTGAQDERITDAVKDLLDYRMRWKRANIFTSQIGGKEYAAQAGKFDNVTSADLKRAEALIMRLREVCRVVAFVGNGPAVPAALHEEQTEVF